MIRKILMLLRIKTKALLELLIRPHRYLEFVGEYAYYKKINRNDNFKLQVSSIYPCLDDRTEITSMDPIYLLQDAWAASKIAKINPKHHVDIASLVKTMSIIAQFIPTTMVDIRPIDIKVPHLTFKKGNILKLPFKSSSIACISSICVLEHIGLGRYGDSFDPWGSEKAIKEILRVTKKNGVILITVPVDSASRVQFNAHRTFTREHIISLFPSCILVEEQYIYGKKLFGYYSKKKGFGTGLYHFRKIR